MSHLRFIADDYEAAEAERRQRDADEASRQARADLDAFYGTAVDAGDATEVRYIEALLADIDAHKPGAPSLLDEIRSRHQPAA
jgi:hypothetical protein